MNLKFVLLLVAGALLAAGDVASATTNENKLDVEAISSKRSLRSHKTSDAEERGFLTGDFAKSDLKKMLRSNTFKNKMFQKWDAHTVSHIREKLKVDPLNQRWKSLLFDYLNVYKKAEGAVNPVRLAANGKKVTFSNKVQARIYKNQ